MLLLSGFKAGQLIRHTLRKVHTAAGLTQILATELQSHRVTELQSYRHTRVLSLRVGEIFCVPDFINSPTRFARRRIKNKLF